MEQMTVMEIQESPQSNPYDEFVGLTKFLETQLKYYHWGTPSYSEHKVLDDLIDDLSSFIDKYVEAYQGIYNARVSPVELPQFSPYESKQQMIEELYNYKDFACQMAEGDKGALTNIVDEIVAAVGKGIYLLSLNG